MSKPNTNLFNSIAADLASCRPELQDVVLCPMCMKQIGRADIGTLTVEHIVPKRLGGAIATLTCRKPCNNDFGHQAQSHLVTLLKINEAFRGRGDLRGSFTVAGHRVPVAAQGRVGGGFNIAAIGGHPATFEAIERATKTKPQAWSLNVTLPYKPGRTSAAILRTAYLIAFHQYGYKYILSKSADLIRLEILAAMKEHSARLCQITGTMPGAFELNGNEPEALTFPLKLADGYEVLFVPMKFQFNGRGYWMFSVLPSIQQNPASLFEDLQRAIGVLGSHNLHMEGDESGSVRIEFALKQ